MQHLGLLERSDPGCSRSAHTVPCLESQVGIIAWLLAAELQA